MGRDSGPRPYGATALLPINAVPVEFIDHARFSRRPILLLFCGCRFRICRLGIYRFGLRLSLLLFGLLNRLFGLNSLGRLDKLFGVLVGSQTEASPWLGMSSGGHDNDRGNKKEFSAGSADPAANHAPPRRALSIGPGRCTRRCSRTRASRRSWHTRPNEHTYESGR
jgi:hypothetical protein